MDEEILQSIMDRFDIIENKLDQLNNSLQLNDYFKICDNQIRDKYTIIDSTGSD